MSTTELPRTSAAQSRPDTASRYEGARRRASRVSELVLPPLIATAGVVLLWQLAVDHNIVTAAAVASPSQILDAATTLVGSDLYRVAIVDTLYNWGIGLGLSLMVAIPLGILLGSNNAIYVLTRFTVDFLRTIPAVAVIPLLLLLYGATHMMAVVLIVFGSLWPSLLQTMYGVHQVDPVARDVSRSYRFRQRDVILRLVLPSAAPFIATGVRIAATMSLMLSIGAELIGGAPGIGSEIALAQQDGRIADLYFYVVTSAIFGVLLNIALITLERKTMRWHYRDPSGR